MPESTHFDASDHGPSLSTQQDDISPQTLKEYEDLFQSLQNQVKDCQNEQDSLRSKLESVIQDNVSLSEQLQAEMTKNSTNGAFVKTLNNNMKQQLDAAIQERNSAIDMWQTALKLVSALENELKDYRDNSHLTSALEKVHEVRAEYSRAISLLEDKLSAASSRLARDKAAREVAEEKVERSQNDIKLLTERYEKRCADVDEALIGKEIALKKFEELQKEYLKAVEDVQETKLSCSELESALERSLARLEEVLTNEAEAREKVGEALNIVDVALLERDDALKQASQATEDVQKLRATINELITEASTEVKAEAEQIKEQYNNRIKSVLLDMRRLQTENKSKNSQIQKLKSDLSNIEAELQRTKRELDSALRDRPSFSALDRKLDGFFRTQEVVGGESVRADLEIEQLKAEIVKLLQSNELEQRQFLLERHVLEEQINVLQTELANSSRVVSELSARTESLSVTLKQKDNEIVVLKKALMHLSSMNGLDTRAASEQTDSIIADQLRVWDESNKMYQELQNQLDCQRALTNKWKSEVNLITSRFQSRLMELHSEASALRRENREIHNQLQTAKYKLKSSPYGAINISHLPG